MEVITISKEELENIIEDKLKSVLSEQKFAQEFEEPIKIAEVARIFGVNKQTIVNWEDRNIIPFFKIGGRKYYYKSRIAKALERLHND